jgi:hypothetical protein
MFRVVRVNNENHPTYQKAMHDMATIIERGFYWKMTGTVDIPQGTPLIAMGSYGGRGLYLLGISNGDWEHEPDGEAWQYRIKVVWQPVVYDLPAASTEIIGAMGVDFNVRFGGEYSQVEFRKALDYVLTGEMIDPWQYMQDAA